MYVMLVMLFSVFIVVIWFNGNGWFLCFVIIMMVLFWLWVVCLEMVEVMVESISQEYVVMVSDVIRWMSFDGWLCNQSSVILMDVYMLIQFGLCSWKGVFCLCLVCGVVDQYVFEQICGFVFVVGVYFLFYLCRNVVFFVVLFREQVLQEQSSIIRGVVGIGMFLCL